MFIYVTESQVGNICNAGAVCSLRAWHRFTFAGYGVSYHGTVRMLGHPLHTCHLPGGGGSYPSAERSDESSACVVLM